MHATVHLTPRSVRRYQPLGVDLPEVTPWIKRASHTLTRPLAPLTPHNATVVRSALTKSRKSRLSWEAIVGLSMVMTFLLIVLSHAFVEGGTALYDTAVYGTPRTFQIDARVGHEGASQQPSHFIEVKWDYF